jgi:integrase
MSSTFSDRGRLVVAFTIHLAVGAQRRVRLYTGLDASRRSHRSPLLKEINQLIEGRRWPELARKFPDCFGLRPFLRLDEPTLKEFSSARLEEIAAARSAGTASHYRSLFRSHLWKSEFSELKVRAVHDGDVVRFLGSLGEKGLSIDRINKMRRALFSIFRVAVRRHLADDNPVAFTEALPREDEPEVNPFSAEDARAVIEAVTGQERALITVLIGAGLRPSEALGLRRSNVDFDSRKIHVRKAKTALGEAGRRGDGNLKTKRSRRSVDMEGIVAEALSEQIKRVQLRSNFVFPNAKGGPMDAHNFVNRRWKKILKSASVEYRTLYQCRHTFARLLLERGLEVQYIADQLGHRDLQMLIRHYGRWMPGRSTRPDRTAISEALGLVRSDKDLKASSRVRP